MDHSLLTTYRVGWQDGCDAARVGSFSDAQAAQDAHCYMELAVMMWGLTQRDGVRVLYAYHAGFVHGGACTKCTPPADTPPAD